ncbi:MAG: hypothetical protein WD491_06050 [Balneolales bacterium]
MGTVYLIITDGLGAGVQEDSHVYGDEGCNTLGHVSEVTGCQLPNLEQLGLGNIIPLASIPPAVNPQASYGKMREVSSGKDSTTGHWGMAGVKIDQPFPTYPNEFPEEVLQSFLEITSAPGILANKPWSGTDVIDSFGKEHLMSAHTEGFVFMNLIDTDQLYGHRNDAEGYGESLREFDRGLPAILKKMNPDDTLIITKDHGNDLTTPGTDHSWEFVPLI